MAKHEYKNAVKLREFITDNGDNPETQIFNYIGDERLILKSGETYSLSEGEEVIKDAEGYSVKTRNGNIIE